MRRSHMHEYFMRFLLSHETSSTACIGGSPELPMFFTIWNKYGSGWVGQPSRGLKNIESPIVPRWEISAAQRSRGWHWNLAPFTPCPRGAMWWRFFFSIFGTIFFGVSLSLASLKFGMEQARGKPLCMCLNDHWAVFSCGDRTRQSRHFWRSLSWLLPACFQIFFKETNRTFVGEVFSFNLRPLDLIGRFFAKEIGFA